MVEVASAKIFLSHASADVALAKLLRDTLVRGGVPTAQIFFSSARSTGIPSGKDVGTYLREQLDQASLVIELISKSFLGRPMCLMELGGAWVMQKSTYPIVLPPLSRDEAVKAIGNVHMGDLNNVDEIDGIFNELSDRIEVDLGIRTQMSAWSEAVTDFRSGYPTALKQVPHAISSGDEGSPAGNILSNEDDEIQLANVSVVGRELHGEATNTDSVEYSMISVTATFYSADGTISGTDQDIVSNLKPGRKRTFTLRNIPKHHTYKLDTNILF